MDNQDDSISIGEGAISSPSLGPQQQQQQQQLRQAQRLPNECLYLIIDHLCSDLKTLLNLLTVNKFFFNATLPRLFGDGDPLVVWDMNYISSKYDTEKDKLFALIFVSFMQARLEESQCDPEDDQQVDRILSGILKQYGLKMTTSFKPFLPSGLDMVESIFWHSRNYYNDEIKEFPRNPAQRTTVDYSKFMTVLWMDDWRFFPSRAMIRLCKLPDYLRRRGQEVTPALNDVLLETNVEEPSGTALMTTATADMLENNSVGEGDDQVKSNEDHSNDSDDDDDEKLVFEHLYDSSYTWALRDALQDMWLHYNCECVTSFVFEMEKAQKYLPLSTKMAKLQVIHLNRLDTMPDSYLENTILFIRQNLTAFPGKRLLDIQFDGTWYLLDVDGEDNDIDHSLTDLPTYNAGRKNYRERMFRFMQPAIKIYETLGRPEAMQADDIPKFYDLTKHIDLDRLGFFSDKDMARIDQGERAGMEAFLRRCENLKELNLGVGNHDILSWAVADARSNMLPPSRRALKNLETLELWTSRFYNLVVHALNDAVVSFSTSLRSIAVEFCKDYDDKIPYPLKNAQTMESLRLQRLDSATTIGDWSILLPNLRTIQINLKNVASVNVGSFNQCPNLNILEIRFGCIKSDECRPKDIAPSSIPESGELLDLLWRQPEIDCTLFPKWNLPNLKQLKLYDLAAMRFNFTSLTTMLRLRTLAIEVDPKLCFGQDLDINSRQLNNPMSQPTATLNNNLKQGMETFSSRSSKIRFLPELKELILKGPSSALIVLDCLRSFPRLESIYLHNFGDEQEMRRHAADGFDSIFCQTNSQAEGKNIDKNPQGNDPRSIDDDTPFLESCLKKFKLDGDWLISAQDVTSLLTTYAPFLEKLSVTRLNSGPRDGYMLLEAINNADKINKAYEAMAGSTSKSDIDSGSSNMKSSQCGSIPGRNLVRVKSKYSIEKRDLRSLGLRNVTYREKIMHKKHGVRTYELLNYMAIRREDYSPLDEKTSQESDDSSEEEDKENSSLLE